MQRVIYKVAVLYSKNPGIKLYITKTYAEKKFKNYKMKLFKFQIMAKVSFRKEMEMDGTMYSSLVYFKT